MPQHDLRDGSHKAGPTYGGELWSWDTERLPRKPFCTNDFRWGVKIRPRSQAVGFKYLQVNLPCMISWLILDVDRPGAAECWPDAALPVPTWTCTNPSNGHAHLCWGLSSPVYLGSAGSQRPARYLAAIERSFARQTGADLAYGGLLTKNPSSSAWISAHRNRLYELGELAEYADFSTGAIGTLTRSFGVGRNATLFEALRRWAYQSIDQWRGYGCYERWLREVTSTAMTMNRFACPLDEREVGHLAKSVANWVWRRYAGHGLSEAEFAARQASRGARKGLANRVRGQQMLRDGASPGSVAAALQVSPRTIINWRRSL